MNKILLSSLLAMLIFTGCDDSEITSSNPDGDVELLESDERSDSDDENEESSYEEENDDDERNELHNQGASCLSCHGSSSSDERFTSGGTVYTEIDSVSGYATGYKIRLVLENTPTIVTYSIEEGDGNSYTEYAVDTASKYTAQVINSAGTVVNSSTTNSHDGTRLDCNICHTASGISGAPGRITSFDYYATLTSVVTETNTTTTTTTTETNTTVATTTTAISFANSVMPVLESKCKSCHTTGGLNEQFSITDSASTYTNVSTNGYTNTTSVDSSLLLTKGIGTSHAGGAPLINSSSTEYQTIRDWISQGALNN